MACTGSPQLRATRVNAANRCASTEEGSIWRRYPLPCRTTSCPAPMPARALRSLETRICRALDGSSGELLLGPQQLDERGRGHGVGSRESEYGEQSPFATTRERL